MSSQHTWWKEAVVYQVYPMSFKDGNNDGIGDLPGLIEKVDYLQYLGVNALWISPVYDSPNDDNGYDIRDYLSIAPQFGTMKDMEVLIEKLHARGIRLIMDWVANHTSDEHEWFQKAFLSRDNPYHDFFIFRSSKEGTPGNWRSMFGGSTWQYVERLKEYYFHLYSRKMPDLNWENAEMRKAVYSIMERWIKKGVDGFRLDSIATLSKHPDFPSVPETGADGLGWGGEYFLNLSRVHDFLREMNERVFSPLNVMTVGETGFIKTEDALKYAGYDRGELDTVFQFELFDQLLGTGDLTELFYISPSIIKDVFTRWQTELQGKAWNTLFLENHDLPRSVSLMGNDGKWREKSAKVLSTLLLTLQGTPYLYQGQEIGMTNADFGSIDDYRDIATRNIYKQLKSRKNLSEKDIMKVIHHRSRDNARTPMQWDDSVHAGFGKQTPWIDVNANSSRINVERELKDSGSILHYNRWLIKLRKVYPDLVYGAFEPAEGADENVFAYSRTGNKFNFSVSLNLGGSVQKYIPPQPKAGYEILSGNYPDYKEKAREKTLRPFEARVFIRER